MFFPVRQGWEPGSENFRLRPMFPLSCVRARAHTTFRPARTAFT